MDYRFVLMAPNGRVPGQRVGPDRAEMARMLAQRPPADSGLRVLEYTDPVASAARAVSGLGLAPHDQSDWADFIEQWTDPNKSEIAMREALVGRCMDRRLDPAMQRAILARAGQYRRFRDQRVQPTRLVSLRKAEARGGSYYRRVPKPGGGYRYFYDEAEYKASKGAHTSGDDAMHARAKRLVDDHVSAAGKKGAHLKTLKAHAKKLGSKTLTRAIRAHLDDGTLELDGEVLRKTKGKKDDR